MSKKSFIGDDGKEYEVKEKVPFYKKKWFVAIAVLFLIGSCSSLLGGKDEEKKEETKTEAVVSGTDTENKVETETEIETEVVTETETEEVAETEYMFDPDDYRTDLTYEDLARYPDDNMFTAVSLGGRVIQVMKAQTGETQFRLAVNDDINQVILVELSDEAPKDLGRILEDDMLTVYGTAFNTIDYTTVMGDVRTVPVIIANHYDYQ